uniref:E2F/DP family winged-helix DNA-binding domain-containing protein n=1 Tax=Anopheles farauti TaxID=69004 RepID=A0A182PZG5_9DIPT
MAQPTKPVNFVLQDPKPGQPQIFHVVNTATGVRTALPAGVSTMKTIVTKDLAMSGLTNHGQDAMSMGTDNVGIVSTPGTTTATAVIGGQSFTMPVVRKLSPGQKLIPVAKHKLILPTSAVNKNVNAKVVITPKLYKVISATNQHSVSRNLTFSPPTNNGSLQGTVTTVPVVSEQNLQNFTKSLNTGAPVAIPSTSAMSKPSVTVPTNTASSAARFNIASKTPSAMHSTAGEIVSSGSKIVINNGPSANSNVDSVNDSATYSSVTYGTSKSSGTKAAQTNQNNNAQSLQHSYSKKTSRNQIHTPASRRQAADKTGRGLRHFSMKVCEKVKAKGTTTYNEVANELVAEETQNHHPGVDPGTYDQKNIRRRVYDALNVLMAMKIISKEKKEIRWHGLPTSNTLQECEELEKENEKARRRIEMKQQQLFDLVQQHVALKSLISRNKANEERGLVPNPSSAVQLPFIIVNTDRKTNINCNISNDKSEYSFKFEDSFEIHDDVQILKRIGLSLGLEKGQCSEADLKKIKSMVPKSIEKYIDAYGLGLEHDEGDDWEMSSLYNGQDNDDSLSTQDMLGFNDTTNDMLDDDMKFDDDEDD